jgi:hypothetical protein
MSEFTVLDTESLLPTEWRHFSTQGPVRAFNPGLLRTENGWLLAYRIVGPDGLRRIGLCRLDTHLRVIPGSPFPFSDRVTFAADQTFSGPAKTWFADPRLYRFDGRVFVYWNSGWHEPRNFQFLQELREDTLEPVGHPRELVLCAQRQPLEKNWTFFGESGLHAVYSASPHRVLNVSLAGEREIACSDVMTHELGDTAFERAYGRLRGGAPPQLWNGHYWSFCHSVAGTEGNYRYVAGVYCFSGSPPFAPTGVPERELPLGGAANVRRFPKLNPAVGEVIYPCGAAREDGRWLISYGVNDELCAIASLSDDEVTGAVRPIGLGQDCSLQEPKTQR